MEPTDEAPDLSPDVQTVENALDAEILRLLIPATLAVFLDPAMALIDTGVCTHLFCGGCDNGSAPSAAGSDDRGVKDLLQHVTWTRATLASFQRSPHQHGCLSRRKSSPLLQVMPW